MPLPCVAAVIDIVYGPEPVQDSVIAALLIVMFVHFCCIKATSSPLLQGESLPLLKEGRLLPALTKKLLVEVAYKKLIPSFEGQEVASEGDARFGRHSA